MVIVDGEGVVANLCGMFVCARAHACVCVLVLEREVQRMCECELVTLRNSCCPKDPPPHFVFKSIFYFAAIDKRGSSLRGHVSLEKKQDWAHA